MNKKYLTSLIGSSLWISFSEFIRNEVFFKSTWLEHYSNLGLLFKTTHVNGFIWFLWSFLLSFLIINLLKKFDYYSTVLISWLFSFPMMWLVLWNLQVLPLSILLYAIPLSFLEIYLAVVICRFSK